MVHGISGVSENQKQISYFRDVQILILAVFMLLSLHLFTDRHNFYTEDKLRNMNFILSESTKMEKEGTIYNALCLKKTTLM